MKADDGKNHREREKPKIEKLIAFFKTFSWKKPPPDQAEDDRRHQTEADYQREQAEWMRTVAAKKTSENERKNRDENGKSD